MTARAKGQRVMQSDRRYKQEYQEEELLCIESDAQIAAGIVLLKSNSHNHPMENNC